MAAVDPATDVVVAALFDLCQRGVLASNVLTGPIPRIARSEIALAGRYLWMMMMMVMAQSMLVLERRKVGKISTFNPIVISSARFV